MEENNTQQVSPQMGQSAQPEQPTYQQPVYQQPFQPQQPVYQQSMYSPIPPVITPYNENNHKKGKGIIIAIIIVAVVALLALGTLAVYKLFFQSPAIRLTKGFTNMAAELVSYNKLGDMDLQTITDSLQERAVSADVVMNVTVADLDTVGIDYTIDYDYANQKMKNEFSVSAYNIDLVNGRVTADGNRLFISLPDVMQDTYYVDTDTLGKDYQTSVWSDIIGYYVPEDLSFEMFPELKEKETSSAASDNINKVISQDCAAILKTMKVENSGDAVEIERDGKTVKCNGVCVTFKEEDLNTLMHDIYIEYAMSNPASEMNDVLNVRFADDVKLSVYIDGKGRIVNISTPEKIQLENWDYTKVGFSFVFDGSKRALDHISGTMKLQNEDESLKINLEREALVSEKNYDNNISLKISDSDSDEYINFIYVNSWDVKNQEFELKLSADSSTDNFECKVKGDLTDIEKGKSFTLNIGDLEMIQNDQRLFHISGSVGLRPFEDSISIPGGGKEFMGLSEDEAVNLVTEIYNSYIRMFSGL